MSVHVQAEQVIAVLQRRIADDAAAIAVLTVRAEQAEAEAERLKAHAQEDTNA